MKYSILFVLALCLAGFAVAQDDPLNPPKDCACGPDCPCKAAAMAAAAKVQSKEPPRAGHYVTVCDGKSCHQVFVPDAVGASPDAPALTYASPPAKFYHFQGSPTYCVSDDGTVTETRVRFMHRGPVRRFFSRR